MGKPRVIISSDIGGSDNDDMESMAHALLYADKLDIKAIISTPTAHAGRTSDIYKALDAYTTDYNNLKTWGDYPPPDSLKSVVYQGNINVPGPPGYSTATAGSKAIISAAHQASASDPLYVLAWGAMTDIAQALHDDPSIAGNLRILSSNGWNSTQDPYSRAYVYNNFKDVWWIESNSTHRGIYVNSSGVEGNPFQMSEAKGHGALGDYFYNARPWGIKMGDSWSTAYLLDTIDNANPGGDSWGGTFLKNGHGPNFYTDDPNPLYKVGTYNGAAYVREHQLDIYNSFYKQFAKAHVANTATVNVDDPVHAKADAAATQNDKSVIIKVLLNDIAADGGLKVASADTASTYGGRVAINADGTITYTPKAGYVGTDTFKYVAKDIDGDTSGATVTLTVTEPTTTSGTSTSTGGTSNPVVAKDDAYSIDAGTKLYFNTNHLLYNDSGLDGGLKAAISSTTSANGVALEKWTDGTIVYRSALTNGTDHIDYKLTDVDGSSDIGTVFITIKNGLASTTTTTSTISSTTPTSTTSPSTSSTATTTSTHSLLTGDNNGLVAGTDNYKIDIGKTFYLNTRYVTGNDTGGTGSLSVVAVDAASERGAKVSWGAEGTSADGTLVYKAPLGFEGIDSITYKVIDQAGHSDLGTILVHVGTLI